jgi:hypothetical protein
MFEAVMARAELIARSFSGCFNPLSDFGPHLLAYTRVAIAFNNVHDLGDYSVLNVASSEWRDSWRAVPAEVRSAPSTRRRVRAATAA